MWSQKDVPRPARKCFFFANEVLDNSCFCKIHLKRGDTWKVVFDQRWQDVQVTGIVGSSMSIGVNPTIIEDMDRVLVAKEEYRQWALKARLLPSGRSQG